jgi:hypothetical protein
MQKYSEFIGGGAVFGDHEELRRNIPTLLKSLSYQRFLNLIPMNSIKFLRIILIFFIISCIISAFFSFFLYFKVVTLKGPNSTGEAGKVYYAHKFQLGENFLASGKTPPYYPAVHGVLLHSSVGAIGRLVGADIEDLYYIGRSITSLFTLISLLIVFIICQKFMGDFRWSLLSLALFLAPFRLQQFASSYRPDHWILCLSLLSCLICIRQPGTAWFCLLAVIPTMSYLIKAPGIIISICIFLSFIIYQRYKAALVYALSSALFFLATIFFLQWVTHGLFAFAFIGGMKAGFSVRNAISSFNYPTIWLPILMVPAICGYLIRHSNVRKENLRIVLVFWGVETFVALVTATRYGSYVYYFLQAYAYSTIFFILWVRTKYNEFINKKALRKVNIINFIIILIAGTLFILIPLIPLVKNLPFPTIDRAVVDTLSYGKERHQLADLINKNDLKCYSNDAGLNVLLNKSMIIYPYVQHLMFISGYLDKQLFFDQIREHKFNLIILTRHSWSWQGITQFPKGFFPLLHKYYRPLETNSSLRYLIYIPKFDPNSLKIETSLREALLPKYGM